MGFDKVEQTNTLLGKFNRFERSEDGSLTLYYTGGARCWGADARTATVSVTCGDENRVVSVAEPNKCQYEMKVESPVGCTDRHYQELQLAVEQANEQLNVAE